MKSRILGVAAVVLWVLTGVLTAQDWPTWRHDARRSAATDTPLPSKLDLHWERALPSFEPAWPTEPRLRFDPTYEPVAADGRLFVGSPLDGSVRTYDLANGKELWCFFTDGPVRFAPVVAGDRLLVASDDGRLYCLATRDGSCLWHKRVIGDDRPDLRQLANDRLASCWPVRGGPVVHDGIVYVGCGLWPTMGVCVAAFAVEDGRLIWSNHDVAQLDDVRVDHNSKADVAIAPQGYCLFVDDMLVVPSGRSMPARFDPKTGKMLYFVQGYRHGDARVIAAGDVLLVGTSGAVNLEDGREVGNRWVAAGKDAPDRWDGRRRDLFEGPFFPYKFTPALDYRSVIDGRRAYGVHRGRLLAYDLTKVRTSLYEKKVGNQTVRPLRWDVEQLWKPVTLQSGSQEATYASIQAGSRLYTHVGKTLIAVDLPFDERKRPRVAWKRTLSDVPRAMLAASSRLIVVLANGTILCFGEEQDLPVRIANEERPAPAQVSRWSDEATRFLETTSEEIGYAVILGLKDGGLAEELLERSRLHVIAVDNNSQLVDDLRQRWMDRGWYGRRVDVIKGDPATIELPPYVATLVATERPGASGPLATIDPARLARIVRPYGGLVFATGLNTGEIDSLAERWRKISDAGMEVATSGDSVIWRRPDALPGAADWTHETSDAARSYYSSDERVRAPLGILWYGDSDDYGFHKWKDYGRGVKPQVCRGRLFAFNDRTRVLRAVDIYTGRRFWEYTLPTSLVRFVSLPDGVYVAHGRTCEVLDPKTGKPIAQWQVDVDVPQGQQVGVVAVLADGDVLLIGLGFDLPTHSSHPAIQEGLWNARQLVALDRNDGRQLWTQTASRRFNLHAIAMGGGRVYAVDSPSPQELERAVRRGRKPASTAATMHCWDSRSGEILWRQSMASPPLPSLSWLSIRANDDWVAYNRKHDIVLAGKSGRMRALSGATGRELWPLRPGGQQPLIVADDWVLNQSGIKHDVRTGKPLTQQVILKRQGGCNYAVGTRHLLFWRQICASYIDIETGETQSLRNLRSGCSNSIVAAGGIVSVPCYSIGCVCNYPLQTSFAMYHLPELQEWEP